MIYFPGQPLRFSNDVEGSCFFSKHIKFPITNSLARVSSACPQETALDRTPGAAGDAPDLKEKLTSARHARRQNVAAFRADVAAQLPRRGLAGSVVKRHISAVESALKKNRELMKSRKLARAIAVFRKNPAGTNALADKDNVVKKITRYAASLSLPVVYDWAVKVAEKSNLFSVRDVEIAKVAQRVFDIFKEEGIKGFERGSAEHEKALLLLEELAEKIDATATGAAHPLRGLPSAVEMTPEKDVCAAPSRRESASEKNAAFEKALDAEAGKNMIPKTLSLSQWNIYSGTLRDICSSPDSKRFQSYVEQIRQFSEMPKATVGGTFREADKKLLDFVTLLAFPLLTTRGREFDAYRGAVETAERFSLIDDSQKKIAQSALQLVNFLAHYEYRTIPFGSPPHKKAQLLAGNLLAEIGRVHSDRPQLAVE
jgi:hypothetical protein